MGIVSVSPQGNTSVATITRPANATAYSANTAVGAALAAIEFTNVSRSYTGLNGGDVMITGAELEIDVAAIPTGMTSFNLYLFSVTPPSALANGAAFDIPAGDRASFIGKISLGTPVDEVSTLYIRTDQINAHIKTAGTSIFGYLVTVGGFTPAGNSEVYKVTLHTVDL